MNPIKKKTGGVGGRTPATDKTVAAEARSHPGGQVPKGSVATRLQSARDRLEHQKELRAKEAEQGPMGRGAVGGAAFQGKPEDAAPDICPPPRAEGEGEGK